MTSKRYSVKYASPEFVSWNGPLIPVRSSEIEIAKTRLFEEPEINFRGALADKQTRGLKATYFTIRDVEIYNFLGRKEILMVCENIGKLSQIANEFLYLPLPKKGQIKVLRE